MGNCIRMMASPAPKATNNERYRVCMLSLRFLAPRAWAVKPLVPIRKKPKLQKMKLKMVVPRATAPTYTLLSR